MTVRVISVTGPQCLEASALVAGDTVYRCPPRGPHLHQNLLLFHLSSGATNIYNAFVLKQHDLLGMCCKIELVPRSRQIASRL
jgi:hypothetical protein